MRRNWESAGEAHIPRITHVATISYIHMFILTDAIVLIIVLHGSSRYFKLSKILMMTYIIYKNRHISTTVWGLLLWIVIRWLMPEGDPVWKVQWSQRKSNLCPDGSDRTSSAEFRKNWRDTVSTQSHISITKRIALTHSLLNNLSHNLAKCLH